MSIELSKLTNDLPLNSRAAKTPIVGVHVIALDEHVDDRGKFTEIFRSEWGLDIAPVQWSCVRSDSGVLRGVHVHLRHVDYLLLPQGCAEFGLQDLRPGSPTEHVAHTFTMNGASLSGLVIPPGVAHGFYFLEPSIHIYAVSHYWDPADELGCRWDAPGLTIPWSVTEPQLSERDAALPPLDELKAMIPRYQSR